LLFAAALAAAQTPVKHPPGAFVTVNGAKLWYESEGQGPVVVLVPGGPGSPHDYFHPHFSPLASRYRIIYFDSLGRGKSDKAARDSEYTFNSDVEDLEGLRKALNLGRISVIGHSYGGMVAQAYALRYPQSVRSLVLVTSFLSYQATLEAEKSLTHIAEDSFPEIWEKITALRKQPQSTARDLQIGGLFGSIPDPFVYSYEPKNAEAFDAKHAPFSSAVYAAISFDSPDFRSLDFRNSIGTVKSPLLVIAGRADKLAMPRETVQFRRYAPKAEFVMFEKSGHDPFLEEQEKFLDVLGRFLVKQ
jgi:proline iminopeptidase